MSKRPAQAAERRSSAVWITIAVIAALAIVIAIVSNRSSDATPDVPTNVEQTRPVTVTGTALAVLPDSGSDPAIGMTMPELSGSTFDGTPVEIAPGKATLVLALAHWCPHCQREVPPLVAWQAGGETPTGIDVVGIVTSTSNDRSNYPPSAWLAREKFPWPVMADSAADTAAAAIGLSGFPFYVLVDGSGKVVWRGSGEMDPADLAVAINRALGR